MAHSAGSLALGGGLHAVCALPFAASAADSDFCGPGNPATDRSSRDHVIGNTPLQGLGLPLNQMPAMCRPRRCGHAASQTLDLARLSGHTSSGINVSGSAGNPFQLDINYHGFTASPLLVRPKDCRSYVDACASMNPSRYRQLDLIRNPRSRP